MSRGYHTLVDHYEKCLAQHGDSHLGVDWPSAQDAATRYRVMLDVMGESHGKPLTLLDFGCGAAHLYEYLLDHDRSDISYVGVDVSEKFVELCRRKHPAVPFHCIDALADGATLPTADYIVMNGVLTEKRDLSFDDMRQFMERLLPRVFRSARVGLAFNVMSHHVDWQREDLFHLPYDTIAAFLRDRVSRHFVFRADYGLYEYTVYVFREPR